MSIAVSAVDEPVDGTSLVDRLSEQLRERIIVGRYAQGSRVTESRLALDLDVSRAPLREVIPLLVRDGFLVTAPRRSPVVYRWDTRSITDLFDVRLALEPMAASLAAEKARAGDDMSRLRDGLAHAHDVLHGHDALASARVNARFHHEVAECSGNILLASLEGSVIGRMTWLFYLTNDRDPDAQCAEHDEIAGAILRGEPALAAHLSAAHVERGRIPTLDALSSLFE
ncbi:MAG: GntR family transcriptional regulator [Microbacterium sp.]|uniref:GntR family transcriptional regulator n=1 Tax=Microbacterium sp. TaxID=51671 RepID=UPI0039E51666